MSTLNVESISHPTPGSNVTVNGITPASTNQLGNRNLIINGAMEVWQRGTSQTVSGGYGADRFWMANATSAARSTDAPAGFTYSTKLTYNASDMATGQPIELPATGEQGQLVAGETVTLSYYAKVDSGTENIGTSIKFRDSKFSSTNEVSFTSSNPNATWTTTWTRYTHQFTVPTVGSTNILAGLEIAGISKDAYITGVQLERGSVATPFEHRSYGDELARCQRYYVENLRGSGHNATINVSNAWFTLNVGFPVEMRVNPSIVATSPNNGTANRVELWGATDLAYNSFSRGRNNIYFVNTTSSYSTASSIQANFTADAEL